MVASHGSYARLSLLVLSVASSSAFVAQSSLCLGKSGLKLHGAAASYSPQAAAPRTGRYARSATMPLGLRMDQSSFGGFNPHFSPPISDASWRVLNQVYVLLFSPRTDDEGIYTLQQTDDEGNQHHRVVLFESKEDAERFGGLLEAQDFPTPHVESLEPDIVDEFVSDSGYETAYIPDGVFFLPPESKISGYSAPGHWGAEGQGLDGMERERENDGYDYNQERIRMESIFKLFEADSPHEPAVDIPDSDFDEDMWGTSLG